MAERTAKRIANVLVYVAFLALLLFVVFLGISGLQCHFEFRIEQTPTGWEREAHLKFVDPQVGK